MFRNAYRTLLALIIMIIGVSCNDEIWEGQGPQIEFKKGQDFISGDTAISPGQLMHFGILARAGDANITELIVKVVSDSIQVYYDSGMHVPSLNWEGSFTKSFNDNELWEFTVRDRYSQSATVSVFIENDSIHQAGQVDLFQSVILGAQNNPQTGSFFDLSDASVYTPEEAFYNQDLIDLVYYFGEDEHTIASPGANIESGIFEDQYTPVNWEIRYTTRYLKTSLSVEDFDSIQNDSLLIASYIQGEGKRKAKNLTAGDVYAFQSQDMRLGMFRLVEIEGTNEGLVIIDIKIQKEGGAK